VSDHPTPFDKVDPVSMGTPFADMTPDQKWRFSAKLICCICTMGFAFPNVMYD